jgi:hypothetical protein
MNVLACLPKARITAKPAVASEQLCKQTAARRWLISCHVIATTDTHATMEELLDAVFSVRSVPRLYDEDWLKFENSGARERERERESEAERQLRVASVRSEKLVAEAGDSSGTQKKGNIHRWKQLSRNG